MKRNLSIAAAASVLLSTAIAFHPSASLWKVSGVTADNFENTASYSIQDIRNLQDFLLARNVELPVDVNYDFNQDGVWNVFDLCFMKRQFVGQSQKNCISVSNDEELKNALLNAAPGDTIVLQSGIYESSDYGTKSSIFYSPSEGTESAPITIKSADPENPAILKGTDLSKGIVLYITGDYWNIQDMICCNAQKGIVLDHSNYSVIESVEVYDTGQEGIHLRDGSSYCQIIGTNVHDNGLISEYGEAIYIGSAKSTSGYAYDCDHNLVKNCTLGPNTVAESVDIKEYTTGNIIEDCTMYGEGMTATDSFIDIKGNETIVRNNVCYAQENTNIVDGFQLHCQVEGWGIENWIYGNTIYFSGETEYVVRSWSGTSCTVYNNIRNPENNDYMYRAYSGSSITIADE
ncbi:MAG: right-handed parallel beta-helix repeat-containing protein [Ruminococcus sp.]